MDSIDELEYRQRHREAFAKRIVLLRERKKWTTTDLANAAGLAQPSLWAIEKTETKEVTARTVASLVAALETTWDYLWNGADQVASDAAAEAQLVAAFRATHPTARPALVQSVLGIRQSFPLDTSDFPNVAASPERVSRVRGRTQTASPKIDKVTLVNHQGGQNAKRSTAQTVPKSRSNRDAAGNARARRKG